MNSVYIFAGICGLFLILFICYKLTFGKKKQFAKPGDVQKKVKYDERYPNRAKILNKEYNLEDDKPND